VSRCEHLQTRVVDRPAEFGEPLRQRVAGVLELEVVHQLGEPVDAIGVEAERLADFARGAASAVGDDVGRHCRAEAAVLVVDVLDDGLAPVAARQIEVDVGPFAALFGQEALEQHPVLHRVDRRDAEAVADGAVRRRPAPLDEDVVVTAELHDVPDDQEVAGEIELVDHRELVLDLPLRVVLVRAIAVARAAIGQQPQIRMERFTRRHRVNREAIAEILQREGEPIGERAAHRDRFRDIREERRHLLR
jgi:hypothetical protein